MPDPILVCGPLAQLLRGERIDLKDYALPASADCFVLPTPRAGASLSARICAESGLEQLLIALGGERVSLPEGALYAAPDGGGTWDAAAWQAMWAEIAPLALAELLDYPTTPPAILRQRLPMILARSASRVQARRPKPARLRSDTAHERVEILKSRTPHDGFFQTKTYQLRHPRYDGTMSDAVEREVFMLADAAVVLPYDPRRDRVLLIEQFRLGPYGRGDARPWMLEPVAGRIDAGEAPEATARRECEEEAGLILNGLEFVASYYPSPGCLSEYQYCFIGLADLPSLNQGQGGLATEHEDIRTHVLPFAAAQELAQTGEADNAPLLLLLLWLAANRDRLRAAA